MKKLIALLLAVVLCLSLVACGSGNETTTTAGNSGNNEAANNNGEENTEGKTMLLYSAGIGDFGLNDMMYRACQTAIENYGYDFTLVEYGNDSSLAVNSLVDALDGKHYDYVVSMGWYITDEIIARSKDGGEWSDITFILMDCSADMDTTGCDNIYGIAFKQNEGCFMAAVYSALMTKTGKIGVCVNLDVPITNDFGAGWLCGYKYAKNEMGMSDLGGMYTYMGEVTTQANYESMNVVMDQGCDVVLNVGGSVAIGAMQAAAEKGGIEAGKIIIGVDYDQYTYFANTEGTVGYETMVTSMLKDGEACIAQVLDSIESGSNVIEPGTKQYGVAEGGTGLCKNDYYYEMTPADVQEKIEEIEEKIISGEIDVVSYYDFESYDAFATYRDNLDAPFVP